MGKILTDIQADTFGKMIDEEIISMVGTGKKSMTFIFDNDDCSVVSNATEDALHLRFCIITMQNIYRDLYVRQ